jgi:transcriptional regulator with XRE-family HTH domain
VFHRVMLYVAIAEIRGSKGWSQGERAKRAGVTRATLNRLENGHPRSIDLVVLEPIDLDGELLYLSNTFRVL